MLREAFEYLTTPCPPLARRMGYLAEAVALGARHRRQHHAWAPHVEECRRFVVEAASRTPQGGRALVAGSGLLIEVPLDDLARRFDEVVLADIVHARSARRKAGRFANVRLVTMDVTGALAPLADALAQGAPLPSPEAPHLPGERFAFAVSCNLLSQVPLLPLEAIDRRARRSLGRWRPDLWPDTERAAFAHVLARGHLDWLARSAHMAALFSDTESLWLEQGQVVDRDNSLWGVSLPPPDRTWLWDIAPAPEEDPARDLRHVVGAWFDVTGVHETGSPLSC